MKLLRFFKNFLGVYIAIVFMAMLIFTRFIGYQFRRNYACDNIYIFIIVVLLIALSCFLIWKIKVKFNKFWQFVHTDKCFYYVLIIGSLIMFAVQLFIAKGAWFIAGWDTRDVIFPDKQMNNDYMSMYPNQIFLAGLFRQVYILVTQNFGLDFDSYYYTLVIISVASVWASVIFTGLIAKKFTNPFVAIITFLCAVLFLGFSPWIMVPYSDTYAMLFTTGTLLCYCYIKNKPAKWFSILFLSIIGYSIKPTAIFVLCAIFFVEICMTISNHKKAFSNINKTKVIKITLSIVFALLGFGLSSALTFKVCDYGLQIDENRSFTATHFLMMGINLENNGAWNEDDVSISRSYDTVEERQAGNLREWQHRLASSGPFEIAFIFLNKTLTNFNDGSFAWEGELPWMLENKGYNSIVWAFYGIDPADAHDDNNNFSAYLRQALWMVILIGCAFIVLNKKPNREEFVIYISILAISAFLTICEPDPRYFLLYIPFFIMISPKGWQLFYSKNLKRIENGINKVRNLRG